MLHEPDELVELDHRPLLGRQRPGEERRRADLAARQGPRTVERDPIEAPRPLGHQRARVEVAQVERLQRVLDDHPLARRRRVGEPRGAIDDVEQLAERDRRRPPQVRPLVPGRVRDHQVVGRGQHRVEQQLAVLAAGVAIADVRIEEEQVVAVARRLPGEDAVVESHQADDAMRHRPHRDERADREVPGAEARPRRSAAQPVGEQRADLGQRQRRLRDRAGGRALGDDVLEQAAELDALPRLPAGGGRQAVGGFGDRRRPGVERHRIGERVHDRVQALEELGEAAGEIDVAAADVVERKHSPEQPLSLLRHRHAHQHAIPARLPRVRRQPVEPVRGTLRRIEAPAHAAVARPLRDPREVVVVEAEAPADRRAPRQVEHLRGGQPAAGEVEQLGDDAEHRVGLAQRAVGEAHVQVDPRRAGRQRVVLLRLRPPPSRTWRGSAARRPRCRGT